MLYRGIVSKIIDVIKDKGLIKMNRNHVHLSADEAMAIEVGERRGNPIVLRVKSGKMYKEGCSFYQSENGVWLTDCVKSDYIF